MDNIFFLDANKQKIGPLKDSDLLSRGVTPSTLVWMPGLTQWTPAGSVPQFRGIFYPQQTPAPAPTSNTTETNNAYSAEPDNTYKAEENNTGSTSNPQQFSGTLSNAVATNNICGAIGMTVAILLFVIWIPGVGLAISWLVALIFSIIGVCRPQKGMAIAGLVITVLLLLIGIFSLIFGLSFFSRMF